MAAEKKAAAEAATKAQAQAALRAAQPDDIGGGTSVEDHTAAPPEPVHVDDLGRPEPDPAAEDTTATSQTAVAHTIDSTRQPGDRDAPHGP